MTFRLIVLCKTYYELRSNGILILMSSFSGSLIVKKTCINIIENKNKIKMLHHVSDVHDSLHSPITKIDLPASSFFGKISLRN